MIVPFIAIGRYVLQKNRSSTLPSRNNFCNFVKHHPSVEKFHNYKFKRIFSGFSDDVENSLHDLKNNSYVLLFLANYLPQISKLLESSSVNIVKNCLKQVECVVAQRVRRGQQMITLYTRLWEEKALRILFLRMKRLLHRRSKHLILGTSFLAFDWENERISLDDLQRHVDEIKICHVLRRKAFTGEEGEGTKSVCTTKDCPCPECDATSDVHCWEPFIKEEDLTVWKMEETSHKGSGLYCYKMYGKYSDVTANDFLEVFLDTENRTKWDVHAADLKVIDSDPSSNSDVIYWETKWPTFFSNRDYVFKRRFHKDEKNKVIVVMNRSTIHPMYPPTSSKARVTEFWSYMVIKAHTNFSEPGIEFSLTYFDNPGIALPSAITLWITVQGMPDYLKRLRIEALAISEKRKLQEEVLPEISSCPTTEDDSREDIGKKGKNEEPSVKIVPGKAENSSQKKNQTETPPSPPEHEHPLSTYDLILLLSSYMQKLKSSLWL